jgi:hypothetical protein
MLFILIHVTFVTNFYSIWTRCYVDDTPFEFFWRTCWDSSSIKIIFGNNDYKNQFFNIFAVEHCLTPLLQIVADIQRVTRTAPAQKSFLGLYNSGLGQLKKSFPNPAAASLIRGGGGGCRHPRLWSAFEAGGGGGCSRANTLHPNVRWRLVHTRAWWEKT